MDNQNDTATNYSITTTQGDHLIAEVKTEYEKQGLIHVYWFVVNGHKISEHRFMDHLGKPSYHLMSKRFDIDAKKGAEIIGLENLNIR